MLEGPSWLCCTQNSAASSGPLPARSAGKPEPASPSPWKGLKGEALVPTPRSAARLLPSLRAPRRPVVTTCSTQTQGSLPLVQTLFCGLTWPGSWGPQGSSSLAASTSYTYFTGRGTGPSQSFSHLSAVPRHRQEQGQPAKSPWPLSTPPMPPLPPTTAQQLWTRSSHASHCLSGCHSPPTWHANLPRGHLCQPLLEAVSSPSRMDSILRQKRGLPTWAPTLSLSLTVWAPELCRGV